MAECPAFVILRYPLNRHQSAKNSLTKYLSVHNNYTGRVSGLSSTIQCLEGHWKHDKGIAVLAFESMDSALRWTHSTPEVKQPDWLDGVDMILVPVNDLPRQGYRYVQILDMKFSNYCNYAQNSAREVKPFLEEKDVCGAVVATSDIKQIRGLWNPEYLVLNFWKCRESFETSYNSDKYAQMRDLRQSDSTTDMCIFVLEDLVPQY